MGLGIQAYVAVLLWNNLLACEPCLQDSNGKHGQIEYTIINLNGEQMEVLWDARKNLPDINVTMFYKFFQEFKECPQYILDRGSNTGCLFKTEGDHLYVSIRNANGSEELYYDEQKSKRFFKPLPPENITFQWANDTMTAEYSPPKFPSSKSLDFELQYKSNFDSKWQERKNPCCKITVPGFDSEKCYVFRFRLKMSKGCTACYPSEWGAETHWKNGCFVDSCAMDGLYTIILLSSVMTLFLLIFALLVCVCRLERIKKTLMPAIPDPKHMYSKLFSDHNGNFQDWIHKTENVLVETKVEYGEEECIVEENIQGSTVEARGIEKKPVV